MYIYKKKKKILHNIKYKINKHDKHKNKNSDNYKKINLLLLKEYKNIYYFI